MSEIGSCHRTSRIATLSTCAHGPNRRQDRTSREGRLKLMMNEPNPDLASPVPAPVAAVGVRRHLKSAVGLVLIVLVVVLAALAIWKDRQAFSDALDTMGVGTVLLSAAFGLVGVAFTFPIWHSTLRGLNAKLPLGPAMVVFFASQLGKYLPGSVWPVVAQMEAGRRYQINRRTILTGNLFSLAINLVVGTIVACALLPASSPAALHRFWWLLLALPVLLPLMHPRVLPWVLDRVFALLGRPAVNDRLQPRAMLQAAGWGALSWAALGAHVAVLCAGLGHGGLAAYLTSTGAIALAIVVGVLFIPAPAGGGIREVALLLALSALVSQNQGLAIVIVSRLSLVAVDLVLAAAAGVVGGVLRRQNR